MLVGDVRGFSYAVRDGRGPALVAGGGGAGQGSSAHELDNGRRDVSQREVVCWELRKRETRLSARSGDRGPIERRRTWIEVRRSATYEEGRAGAVAACLLPPSPVLCPPPAPMSPACT